MLLEAVSFIAHGSGRLLQQQNCKVDGLLHCQILSILRRAAKNPYYPYDGFNVLLKPRFLAFSNEEMTKVPDERK